MSRRDPTLSALSKSQSPWLQSIDESTKEATRGKPVIVLLLLQMTATAFSTGTTGTLLLLIMAFALCLFRIF